MFNLQHLSLLLLISLQALTCTGQNFVYETVPSKYLPQKNQKYISEVHELQKSAIDLTKYLPSGYVRNGSVDYTKDLQKGIDSNRVVLIPDFPILTSGIHLNNGSTLIFQRHSQLWMSPSNLVFYQIIAINRVHDVKVYFANIKGDRGEHIGTNGEWGFGIGIEASKNVGIFDPIVTDCWGDGIYINNKTLPEQKETFDSNNIIVEGALLDNNRRNGITLVDGNNITIRNSTISNTNGTMPMSGIDIEPNNGNGKLKNIIIDSITTFNNMNFGIIISLASFISNSEKNIDITIVNCRDDSSKYGMGFAFGRTKEANLIFVKGIINVINPIWRNSKARELWLPYYASKNTVKLKFENPKVFKKGEIEASPLNPVILSKSKNIIFN